MCPQVSHSELTAELSAVELKRLHKCGRIVLSSECTSCKVKSTSKYSEDVYVI